MLKNEVKEFFKGDIRDDKETIEEFSHDASIFELKPELVLAPKDSEDIQALVKFVSEKRDSQEISLTPRSGATGMDGGALTESISLDMTAYFSQILDVTKEYATVQPGVYYRDLDKETKRRDVFMPTYPASREICTVGGMVGNNAGSEKSPVYGKTEDYILELKVVLADGNEYEIKPLTKEELDIKMKLKTFEGELYKKLYDLIEENKEIITKAKPNVSKNSAGYFLWNVWDGKTFDLTKLIVGSQATLGIITEIKFKLVPVKKASKLLVVFLKDLKNLGEIIVELKKHNPETIESYDDNTFKLGIKFFPQMVKVLSKGNIFKTLWNLMPEIAMVVFGGIPKMVLMAEFTGDKEEELEEPMKIAEEAMKKYDVKTRITKTEDEEAEFWMIRRESFNLLRKKIKDKHTAPFIDDFAVNAEVLPEFLPKLNKILEKYENLVYTIAGHPGDGNFHIIPLMNLEDENQRMIIPKLSDEVYTLVGEYKGTITAEHGDGLVRTPYLNKMYSEEVLELFKKTKEMFDPKNIFNPGKKVGADLGYTLSRIRKSF